MRCLIVLLLLCPTPIVFAAELTARERRMVQVIDTTIKKAGASYAADQFDQAGASIQEAIRQVEVATKEGSSDLYEALQPAMRRIEKAHTMLEFEGISLPPFERPKRPAPPQPPKVNRDKPAGRSTNKPAPKTPTPMPGISFTNEVAPILASRCGRCHISASKGRFNMATFAALMKGPPEGVVIFAGDTVGSRLIETIETGAMPPNGSVPPEELGTLKAWITSGAKFDGSDPNAPIAGGAVSAPATANGKLQVRRATGRETISFAADVAPLLVDNCNGCHIDAMQTRGGLRMDTFARLLRGGDSGEVINPGQGDQSLLVQKLRGMVGERMPSGGRPALADQAIDLISTWIDEGATFDGASENQPLRVMSQLAWAASATYEQMSRRRGQLADKNLRLVTGGSDVQSKSTDHFLVIGTASEATLDLVGELAETQMKTVRSVVAGDANEDFFHGRATIFVLPRRYDYSEFAKMAEGRSLPSSWTSHWKFDGIDAYVSLVATDRDDRTEIADRLAAPMVSLAVATRGGDVPRWLAEGVGVATARRNSNSRDREARRKAETEVSEALAAMASAKGFLNGELSPQQTDRIGAAIAASLLDRTHRRNFDALLRNLAAGKPFQRAFAEAFRAAPEQFVESWMKWARGG